MQSHPLTAFAGDILANTKLHWCVHRMQYEQIITNHITGLPTLLIDYTTLRFKTKSGVCDIETSTLRSRLYSKH